MKNRKIIKKFRSAFALLCCMLCLATLTSCSDFVDYDYSTSLSETEDIALNATENNSEDNQATDIVVDEKTSYSEKNIENVNVQAPQINEIPLYSGKPYVAVNGNIPNFTELSRVSFENYSPLDSLGRCGVAYASLSKDTMPTEERGSIGQVKPSGWQTAKYEFVDGKYLYNRCHLIGFQLSAENANTRNLITGTRYMNVDGMLPFENMVADYIKETGNHVMYRVTPLYDGNNLVASGVLMEAKSVEDNGDGILFNVFCYNVQPGVTIDYATGNNYADGSTSANVSVDTSSSSSSSSAVSSSSSSSSSSTASTGESSTYILNTNTKKFHKQSCGSVKNMKEANKQLFDGTRDEVISKGYEPCKKCNP